MKRAFFSPLEQFLIILIIEQPIVKLIITNQLIFLTLSFLFFYLLNKLFSKFPSSKAKDIFLIPNNIQISVEIIIKTVFSLLSDNIKSPNLEQFSPIIFAIFLLLINLNGFKFFSTYIIFRKYDFNSPSL